MLIREDDLTLKVIEDCRNQLQEMKLEAGQLLYIEDPKYIIPDYGDDNEEYW